MRNSKLGHGERRFSREERMSKAQLRSFFSRIRAARRKQAVLQSESQIDVDSADDFGPWLQEIELLDQASEENKFRDQINMRHPLVYDIYNLCELCNKKQLAAAVTWRFKLNLEIPRWSIWIN